MQRGARQPRRIAQGVGLAVTILAILGGSIWLMQPWTSRTHASKKLPPTDLAPVLESYSCPSSVSLPHLVQEPGVTTESSPFGTLYLGDDSQAYVWYVNRWRFQVYGRGVYATATAQDVASVFTNRHLPQAGVYSQEASATGWDITVSFVSRNGCIRAVFLRSSPYIVARWLTTLDRVRSRSKM